MTEKSQSIDQKIAELQKKITIEQTVYDGANKMLRNLTDRSARGQCEMNTLESRRRLEFLEGEMRKLQIRKGSVNSAATSPINGGAPTIGSRHSSLDDNIPVTVQSRSGSGQNLFGNLFGGRSNQPSPNPSGSATPSRRASNAGMDPSASSQGTVTNFDYLKYGTAITSEKIRYRLKEVRHKLDVEQKVKAGTENMIKALGDTPASGSQDPAVMSELMEKISDANAKIAFLQKAEHKYSGLSVDDEEEEEGYLADVRLRKTGRLRMRLGGATNLPGRRSARDELVAIVRVDGTKKYETRPTKAQWNETVDIQVDKAQEVEIAVYDRSWTLLGLVWLRLFELEDDLKAKYGGAYEHVDVDETWLDLEPAGQLLAKLNFMAMGRAKTARDQVFRRAPVQKVLPKNGHRFQPQSFYHIMQCALCNEFLGRQGYHCQNCEYTVHAKCYSRVITKCITKDDVQAGRDSNTGQLLRYRIPHRFDATTNLGAAWCAHCGYILPPGRKMHKCTECGTTAHRQCSPLLPFFCGLTPEVADTLVAAWEDAERKQERKEMEDAERLRKEQGSGSSGGMSTSTSPLNTMVVRDEPIQLQQLFMGQQQQPHQPMVPPPRVQSIDMRLQISTTQQQPPGSTSPRFSHHPKPLPPVPAGQQMPPAAYYQAPYYQAPTIPSQTVEVDVKTPVSPQASQQLPVPAYPRPAPEISVSVHPPQGQPIQVHQKQPSQPKQLRLPPTNVTLNDFSFVSVIGRGAFGKVLLAKENVTGQLYAIKALKKEFIIQNDDVKSTKLEKRIFQAASAAHHPFLVNLHSCFQSPERVYFVMEYVSGGDLMAHIQEKKRFSQVRAKFYACEVLLALEYFHRNNIIYRDLKLDNVLLTPTGHIKLADYGICKENMPYGQTTRTFCGTPDYMAPEVLMSSRYGRAVDWWSFGVFIYVMLVGRYPFHGEDEQDVLDAILGEGVEYPSNIPKDTLSLLQGLMNKNPARRLGGGRLDAEEIKRHPYFAGVDWEAFMELRVQPPWVPTIKNATDVSNFDPEFTKERAVLTPISSVLSQVDQNEFRDFEFVSDWAAQTRAER
ncbi:Serine/threonine kinase [Gaertneriomyces sp. JEL0708]|nr:Serine/threonine kinase [Gaertneriomyces sp. JEL0708]